MDKFDLLELQRMEQMISRILSSASNTSKLLARETDEKIDDELMDKSIVDYCPSKRRQAARL